MEIMSALAVLVIGALAVFMYFKTRPARPSPVQGLDLAAFAPIVDPETCGRVMNAARSSAGPGFGGATGGTEECLTDGARFVYRTRGRAGTVLILLDADLRVIGTNRTISTSDTPARAPSPGHSP